MDKQNKILVAGEVCGNFKKFFKRLDDINKKSGPFEITLCVGDFFSLEQQQNDELMDFKNGTKTIPIPTYILGPTKQMLQKFYEVDESGELCTNLTYLGKRGVFTLQSGIKIAYISGIEEEQKKTMQSPMKENIVLNPIDYHFTKQDIFAVRNACLIKKSNSSDYRGVDILLTSEGPHGFNGETERTQGLSKLVTYLCKEIKPRYHFFGSINKYIEPEPYRLPSDNITQLELCVRIVGLAPVANTLKEKYIYALSLTPVEKMRVVDLIQKTTTEKHWPSVMLATYQELNMEVNPDKLEKHQYFFDITKEGDMETHKRFGKNKDFPNKKAKVMRVDQETCWFCLSCPDVEKHLIITVGEYFYLALAKGPVSDNHVLILSIGHIPAAACLSNNEEWQELLKFKNVLKQFFNAQNQVVCFTERNYKSSHLQINCLAIEKSYEWKIEHTFEDKAEEFNLDFAKLNNLNTPDMLPSKGPYFVAELPNDTVLITRQMKRFPLHFARDVFCNENLLNCDEKVDWHDCQLDKETEIQLVQKFREKFKKFDFTN